MLPVDAIFNQLQLRLAESNRVILQAPPGAGKSTRLPLLLLESGHYTTGNQIVILEPRRVAARQIASFLAQQLGESIGETIGLAMRGENKSSSQTIITIVTDGVMVRKIQRDPELSGIGLIIFDEFHERALQTDLALALSIDAQELNEALRLMIMSATIDLATLSTELNAPIVESKGRQFPVTIEYVGASLLPSHDEIVKAILHAANNHSSSILVFLAGVNDITKISGLLAPHLDQNTHCLQLHGRLSIAEQNKAIEPCVAGTRKIVLATNVAQTSLTIEGVDVVVDAGNEKLVYSQPKSGIEQLITQPTSIASAEQRAGRAGRLAPGFCYRLGSKENFERRRRFDVAEIERVDLAQLMLEVFLWGTTIDQLFWLTKPETPRVARACELLASLGYLKQVDSKWQLTALAKQYQKVSTDIRSFRMIQFAQDNQTTIDDTRIVPTACLLAALLEERSLAQSGDVHNSLLKLSSYQWQQLLTGANRISSRLAIKPISRGDLAEEHIGLLLCVAFPDQIAKKTAKRWKLSGGSAVEFHQREVEPVAELVVVASINASKYGNYVGHYTRVNLVDIESFFPSIIDTVDELTWSESKQKPSKLQQTKIGQLILNSNPVAVNLEQSEWQNLWLNYIKDNGLGVLGWNSDNIVNLRNRFILATRYGRDEDWPSWREEVLIAELPNWLAPYLSDVRSLKQLKNIDLHQILLSTIDWQKQQALNHLCPVRYLTPAGHERKLDYLGDIPKLSVKLQEMFGTPTNPAICDGKQPILIELLSPAKRPLQVTQDLNHFWQNAYQDVKKEMKGRYPKHPWPDNPVEFQATTKVKSRL
ncbi:ATP-dependent helicase HrpB [Psychrosphaera sp. 1_MG-2023]|uniref:ATP-dependent helicase HrpB n=1 Tax=Psychrosphaera sp. 1_MG-2023 TaxID=3062643 RepID=UPI0026E1DAB4|nr:ATP-dependent helicase HrpB [Psychrosphaera sp. 1_MG-2023]MDO6718240.1 ATP-dependent helicase HrpB [Psychrosphaera sp. 1_MG-2023]